MKHTPRSMAIDIAKAIRELNRAGNSATNMAIGEYLEFPASYLSRKKSMACKGLHVLKEYEAIAKIKGMGWKLMRPIEEIEVELSKWSKRRQNHNSPVRITRVAGEKEKEETVEIPVRKFHEAKLIRMEINNVTLTIEF